MDLHPSNFFGRIGVVSKGSDSGRVVFVRNSYTVLDAVSLKELAFESDQSLITIVEPGQLESANALLLAQRYLSLRGYHIGSDPEVFVVNPDGTVLPAFTFLPAKSGTQQREQPYWDGFQAEFNAVENTCLAWLTDSVQRSLIHLDQLARSVYPEATISFQDTVDVPIDTLLNTRGEHLALGCAPSRNLYGEKPLCVPDPTILTERSAGAHLHFEIPYPRSVKLRRYLIDQVVQALDVLVGVASVSVLRGLERGIRRQYYGRAGEYRLPAHGLEYRVLSSAVLFHPILWHFLFDLARAAVHIGLAGLTDTLLKYKQDEVRRAINQYHLPTAVKIIEDNKPVYDMLFSRLYYAREGSRDAKKLWDMLVDGGVNHIPQVKDSITANWHLRTAVWKSHCNAPYAMVASMLVGG